MRNGILNKKGTNFISILALSFLMVLAMVASSNMILSDVMVLKRLELNIEALYIAEAGINAVLGDMAAQFSSVSFPVTGTFGGGTYTVTKQVTGGRSLLSSEGRIAVGGGRPDVTKIAAVEIVDTTPTSLSYILSCGNNVICLGGVHNGVVITGNLHANNMCTLNTANGQGDVSVSGTVTYTNDNVYINVGNGADCYIIANGVTFPRKTKTTKSDWKHAQVTFPAFDDAYYRKLADPALGGDGLYYSGDHEFSGGDIKPDNGLVFVNGTATFSGTCHLYGGVIAKTIAITGSLTQHKTGDYNMIVANGAAAGQGNITITSGQVGTDEALLYARKNFVVSGSRTNVSINGVIVAAGDIDLSDFQILVHYTYQSPTVDLGSTNATVGLISWNR
ncbi:MAG: hypothetical protein PHS37_04910 [Candidatus Omnitrophica bacterium]|nr:hypothetical protein [Candidatus Omnitrophota bacterium]